MRKKMKKLLVVRDHNIDERALILKETDIKTTKDF